MDQTSYPRRPSSYQPFLSLMWGNHGTAADAVAERFDWAPLEALEARYEAAAAELARHKDRVRLLRAKHSFEAEDGKKHICPMLLRDLLGVLPNNEPLPPRGVGGAPGVPFQSLLRAWVLAPFYEVEDNAEAVFRALANNPKYLERCQFPGHVLPDVRTFQRFNEVMNHSGLWGEARRILVEANVHDGVLPAPRRLAIDPTHQDGYAGIKTPCAACRACNACDKVDQIPTCEATDLVCKRPSFKIPGVKAVLVTDADTEVPLLAVAVQARAFEGHTGAPAARAFAESYPQLVNKVEEALLDGVFDLADEKRQIADALGGADVLVPINPRARKPRPVTGARGVSQIDPYGVPHCVAGLAMRFLGRDLAREDFVWGCPRFDRDAGTLSCPKQGVCCPNPGKTGRRFRVNRSETPYIDWGLPQHSAEFKWRYAGRTSVERSIGRSKRSLPFERHYGRGFKSLTGHLDKLVLAFHVLASAAQADGKPAKVRSPLTYHQPDRKAA